MTSGSGPVFRIWIPGEPVAQARPRFAHIHSKTRGTVSVAYDEKKSKSSKEYIRMMAAQAWRGQDLLDGPLKMNLVIVRSIPLSWSLKKQAMALARLVLPTTKPDTDNYVKGVKDALKGVVWRDDSLVCEEHPAKIYGTKPGLCIEVSRIDPEGGDLEWVDELLRANVRA